MSAKPGERGPCPHCGVHVHFEAPNLVSSPGNLDGVKGRAFDTCYIGIQTDRGFKRGIATDLALCPSCQNVAITVLGTVLSVGVGQTTEALGTPMVVHPRNRNRPVPPLVAAVNPDLAEDYQQASAVLQDSPKASAALARRCLQFILETKGGATKGETLYKQIGDIAGGLPSDVEELMQAVRKLGNIAAHPKEAAGVILDVEDHEAEFMLEVIEGLFDHYYVRPARNRTRMDAINNKLSSE